MFGEIDIEEHDLMDNPRVRCIFPDLSVLKKEIIDVDEEIQKQIAPGRSNLLGKICQKNQNTTSDSVISHKEEEQTSMGNLVKQVSRPPEIKKPKNSLLYSNVIVFGTKLSKIRDIKLKGEVKINVKDINFYLEKSKCYCQICKTLFPKTNIFEEHKLLKHKDIFSNKRDSVGGQVDNVRNTQINIIKGNPTNKCFHCREIFSTQELLIEHLYKVLDIKAKTRQNGLINDKNYEVQSNDRQNIQQVSVVNKTVEKSKDKSKCQEKSVDTKCSNETISLNSCDAISTEDESCSLLESPIEVFCDIKRNEALQCSICSYYFQRQKFYELHMKRKHKIKVKQINVVRFNPKCVFCSNDYPTLQKYNKHLHRAHSSVISNINSMDLKTQIDKNQSIKIHKDNSSKNSLAIQEGTKHSSLESGYDLINDRPLLFKSVLFKCLKCEIHFLSSKLATSHILHSEILINWKCSLCKIFLKRSDEDLHLKQHKYTESFTVVNVEDKDLSRIIIKCAKCLLHVPKKYFRHHLNVCGANINSWHCIVCDINLTGNLKNKREHNTIHTKLHNKKSDFIIINDTIINNEIYSKNVVQDMESKEEFTSVESTDDNYSSDESNGVLSIADLIAKTKKSSLIKGNSKVKSRSILKNKPVIEDRSQKPMSNDKLITEDRVIGYQNKRKRKLDDVFDPSKNLRKKLLKCLSANEDYLFTKYKFKATDRPIFLLNVTYCKNCESFINFYYTLDKHLNKRCNNLNKQVCNICGIVLTPKTIVRHKEFHKLNPHLKLQDFKFYDIETCEQILPPIPIYPKCNICDTQCVSRDEIRCHACMDTSNLHCDICDEKFASQEALNLHIPFHGYYIQSESHVSEYISPFEEGPAASKENNTYVTTDLAELVSESHNEEETKCESKMMDVDKLQLRENDEPPPVVDLKNLSLSQLLKENNTNDKQGNIEEAYCLYTCEICNVTVDHYDQLVEHCHSHYNNSYKNISTEKCSQCNLEFDRSSMFLHKEMHKTVSENESFETCICDLFYFGRSNADWLNHVFKSLPVNKRENIIKYAIYKNECRIKLHIAQQGDPAFTLYQCTKCSIFIDDSDMFTHREICKGSNKKYPCDYCGIALSSADHRTRHLKLHKGRSLSFNSYRIVVFNRPKDKVLNESMRNKTNQFVIYKCRTCHGIVDWSVLKSHHCNFNDLKKCHNCGLLIYNKNYAKHEAKHKTSDKFIPSNMKVVMFGQIRKESKKSNDMVCSFSGIAFDYIFYKCIKCDVCIRHLRLGSKHFCLIDAAKFKCSRCHLYFDEGQKKSHIAMHNVDSEFTSDVICVIPFDPQKTYQCLEKELSNPKTKNLTDINIEEKSDILYRCPCGLHYLTEENAKEHVKRNKCGVISKKNLIQTCAKCNLNFTPEILYKHLLQHHAEKYIKYSFDVVNVTKQHINDDSVKLTSES